jgi:phosphohistidine phosphatase
MAEWLNQRIAHSTRILVSPALRTQQTAQGARQASRPWRPSARRAPEAC